MPETGGQLNQLVRDVAELSGAVDALNDLCKANHRAVEKQFVDQEKYFTSKMDQQKELLDKQGGEADANHRRLQDRIDTKIDGLTRELDKRLGEITKRYDSEISSLRTGRATDEGRRAGMRPMVVITTSVIGAILAALIISFITRPVVTLPTQPVPPAQVRPGGH